MQSQELSTVVYNSLGIATTLKRAFATLATDGERTIIPAVSNKKIRVHAMVWQDVGGSFNSTLAAGTGTVFVAGQNDGFTPQSNSTPIGPATKRDGYLPFVGAGWMETVAGEALKATVGDASGNGIGVYVVYSEV